MLWDGFSYNPKTGLLFRHFGTSKAKAGIVGHPSSSNKNKAYLKFKYKYKQYMCHRVAYEIHTQKEIPPGKQIDHKNGIKTDNRIVNLRLVTCRENHQNRDCHRAGHLVGTSLQKGGKYKAAVCINGKVKHLGVFKTAEEAHKRYLKEIN